jgi:hypothetical protein
MLSWPEKRLRKGVKKRVIQAMTSAIYSVDYAALISIYSGDDAALYRHLVARLNPIPIKLKPIIMFQAPIPGIGRPCRLT